MKGLKPTLVTVIAIGLLAGSAVGVTAQEDAADELLFAIVDNPKTGRGEFTGYGDIPAGTVTRETLMYEPPGMASTVVVDPGPPGGDTFRIQQNGVIQGTLDSGVIHGLAFWSIVSGSGTGEYADLTGKGRTFAIFSLDDDWGTGVFVGRMGTTEE